MNTPPRVEVLAVPGLKLVEPGDDLARLIGDALDAAGIGLVDGDVVAVAQKVVSKAEGRFVDLAGVVPSAAAEEWAAKTGKDPRLVEVILSESNEVVRHRPNLMIVEHRWGHVAANAGVDRSNIGHDGRELVLLLPEDPDASAERLRAALAARFGASAGVIVTDSVGRAWRAGTTAIALGCAGVLSVDDIRGEKDLYGRTLEVSVVGHADQIASAAALVVGEAAEGMPVAVVRGLSVPAHTLPGKALIRPKEEDLFR